MANKDVIASQGEVHAVNYLEKLNYSILHRNWRHSRFEMDIIATREEVLHFIAVKSLSSEDIIYPEKKVTAKKFLSLKKAASAFLSQHRLYQHLQFDVLSVIVNKDREPECLLIEDICI